MKKILLSLLILVTVKFNSTAQNIPIDFEDSGNGADWTWKTFENDSDPILEVVDNPSSSGINTSSKVAKFTALSSGKAFAGCESAHGADIGTFNIDESNSIIRIMVWKSNISDVGIKLVRADNWSLGELKVANTLVDQWEQLEFDFSAHKGNTYDQIVIFPDFADRSIDRIVYFDNIYGPKANPVSISKNLSKQSSLYPNPASDYINIPQDPALGAYKVFSISGQRMADDLTNLRNGKLDISQLPSGSYLLEMNTGFKQSMHRFVKL